MTNPVTELFTSGINCGKGGSQYITRVKQTWPNDAADIQIGKTSVLIHPKMLYMYVIYTCIMMEPLAGLTHTRSLKPSTQPKPCPKRERREKLCTFVSVNYSSAHHQLPEVLPVLPGDRHHAWIQSGRPLLKEDSNLELPGTVYKRKCITSVHENGYTKTRTLLLLEGGEGRSCGSEVRSKIYMQVIIHAQEWMTFCIDDNSKRRVR